MKDTDNADMTMQLLHDCICNAVAAVHGCPVARTSTTQHRHQPWFDLNVATSTRKYLHMQGFILIAI